MSIMPIIWSPLRDPPLNTLDVVGGTFLDLSRNKLLMLNSFQMKISKCPVKFLLISWRFFLCLHIIRAEDIYSFVSDTKYL